MVFNSVEFLAFFAVILGGYFFIPQRARWVFLLAASCYFYAVGSVVLLGHLALTTIVTYWFATWIEAATEPRPKRSRLQLALFLLVLNLFVFKYTAFFNENVRALFGWFGAYYPVPAFHPVLPLGISFYTFQLISYVVDVYRGAPAERHLGKFSLYVAFFPKLVAGPIERAKNLLPQLHAEHSFDYQRVASGLQLMLWGLFQKVVVADRLAVFVDRAYSNPQNYDGVSMVLATWLFAFQVYCDFSGYTDIAIGAAQTLGIKLSPNFNRPYFATSVQEFWKCWHMSLTSWLTDYIYTPLTRTKKIKIKWYYLMLGSLLVTFVISGVWHGANWTFIAWGALHGIYLVVGASTQKWRTKLHKKTGLLGQPRLHRALKVASTFGLVCFGYVFFRAASIGDSLYIIRHLPTGWGQPAAGVKALVEYAWADLALGVMGIAVVIAVDAMKGKKSLAGSLEAGPRWVRWGVLYAGVVSILLVGALYGGKADFIYVRF